jgi:hypothetical protein
MSLSTFCDSVQSLTLVIWGPSARRSATWESLANTSRQPVLSFPRTVFKSPSFYLGAVFDMRNLVHCLPWASKIRHGEGSFWVVQLPRLSRSLLVPLG